MARKRRKKCDLRVYLTMEAPRIGCGWRGITVVKRGRKWTRVTETSTGIPAKIDNRTFAAIERRAR